MRIECIDAGGHTECYGMVRFRADNVRRSITILLYPVRL